MTFKYYYILIMFISLTIGSLAKYLLQTYANPVLAVAQADPNGSLMIAQTLGINWVFIGGGIGFVICLILVIINARRQ